MTLTGQARTWALLEDVAVCGASILFYKWLLASWLMFTLLLPVPELSRLGYLAGPTLGARLYNLTHNYAVPVFLAMYGIYVGREDVLPYALIWMTNVGMNRAFGIGLK